MEHDSLLLLFTSDHCQKYSPFFQFEGLYRKKRWAVRARGLGRSRRLSVWDGIHLTERSCRYKGSIISCTSISSRLISIRISARPHNITVIQVYAPTTDHKDEEVEQCYGQLDSIIIHSKDSQEGYETIGMPRP